MSNDYWNDLLEFNLAGSISTTNRVPDPPDITEDRDAARTTPTEERTAPGLSDLERRKLRGLPSLVVDRLEKLLAAIDAGPSPAALASLPAVAVDPHCATATVCVPARRDSYAVPVCPLRGPRLRRVRGFERF